MEERHPQQNRPAARPLLLRHQDRLDSRQCARRAQQAEQGKLAFGTVDTWLIWNLTSGQRHITDRTNASRTLLYNIVEDRWDDDLLNCFTFPTSMMPEVVWSSEAVGDVTTRWGWASADCRDRGRSAVRALRPALRRAGRREKYLRHRLLPAAEHRGEIYPFPTAADHDARLQPAEEARVRARRQHLRGRRGGAVAARQHAIFLGASPTSKPSPPLSTPRKASFLCPHSPGLGAPHWDPYASGMIIGIQRSTQIGHIARAAIESIAFQVADVLHAMDRDTQQPFRELRVDGGAAANDMLMQFQADLLQLPVRRPAVLETTALGAAYLAGLAVGFWSGTDEIGKLRGPDTVFKPKADRKEMERRQEKWQDAVKRAGGWNRGRGTGGKEHA